MYQLYNHYEFFKSFQFCQYFANLHVTNAFYMHYQYSFTAVLLVSVFSCQLLFIYSFMSINFQRKLTMSLLSPTLQISLFLQFQVSAFRTVPNTTVNHDLTATSLHVHLIINVSTPHFSVSSRTTYHHADTPSQPY